MASAERRATLRASARGAKARGAPREASAALRAERVIRGFAPIADARARVLVLGTMPSAASLRAQQYYAHPQNRFWRLLGGALGCELPADYAARTERVRAAGLAIWDVLHACTRPGSLDADIDPNTAEPNDFGDFFARHPQIRRVFFNGATAETLYRRRVLPALSSPRGLAYLRLPSSSPANASISLADKQRAWSALADALRERTARTRRGIS